MQKFATKHDRSDNNNFQAKNNPMSFIYISGVRTRVQNVKAKMAEIDVQCQMFSARSNTAP